MTKLEFYKSYKREELGPVAEAAETSVAHLEQLCRGYRKPSIAKAKLLVAATGGQVPLEEWLPELKGLVA